MRSRLGGKEGRNSEPARTQLHYITDVVLCIFEDS